MAGTIIHNNTENIIRFFDMLRDEKAYSYWLKRFKNWDSTTTTVPKNSVIAGLFTSELPELIEYNCLQKHDVLSGPKEITEQEVLALISPTEAQTGIDDLDTHIKVKE